MGSSVLITGKISTTPSQFRDPVILRVKTFIIGIYGKYESNTDEGELLQILEDEAM